MSKVLVETDKVESNKRLKEHLDTILSEQNTLEETNIHTAWQHPDWEFGDECPVCAHDVMSVIQPTEELYRSGGGETDYMDHGNELWEPTDIMCMECQTKLRRTPSTSLEMDCQHSE